MSMMTGCRTGRRCKRHRHKCPSGLDWPTTAVPVDLAVWDVRASCDHVTFSSEETTLGRQQRFRDGILSALLRGTGRSSLSTLLLMGIVFGTSGPIYRVAYCQEIEAPAAPSPDDHADMFFAKHCRSCHSGPDPKGDFDLTTLSRAFDNKNVRRQWLAVLEQIREGNMPPARKPQPPAEDVKSLSDWISDQATKGEVQQRATQGRVVLRRLNRNEYANTVRDLLDCERRLERPVAFEHIDQRI